MSATGRERLGKTLFLYDEKNNHQLIPFSQIFRLGERESHRIWMFSFHSSLFNLNPLSLPSGKSRFLCKNLTSWFPDNAQPQIGWNQRKCPKSASLSNIFLLGAELWKILHFLFYPLPWTGIELCCSILSFCDDTSDKMRDEPQKTTFTKDCYNNFPFLFFLSLESDKFANNRYSKNIAKIAKLS